MSNSPSVSSNVKPASVTLDEMPVTTLRGVGPRSRAKLEAFGLETVQDVLFHLPRRYEDRTRIVAVVPDAEVDAVVQKHVKVLKEFLMCQICRLFCTEDQLALQFWMKQ